MQENYIRLLMTTTICFQLLNISFFGVSESGYCQRGIKILYLYIYLFTAIGLLPGGSGYFTRKQNMKLVTTRFKSGGLHEKHVVATWNVGNHLSICL